jgi:hypothetical protein
MQKEEQMRAKIGETDRNEDEDETVRKNTQGLDTR